VEDNGVADAPDDSDGRVRARGTRTAPGLNTIGTVNAPGQTQPRGRGRGADDAPGHIRHTGLDDLAMQVGS
jgi:hypothetical protein